MTDESNVHGPDQPNQSASDAPQQPMSRRERRMLEQQRAAAEAAARIEQARSASPEPSQAQEQAGGSDPAVPVHGGTAFDGTVHDGTAHVDRDDAVPQWSASSEPSTNQAPGVRSIADLAREAEANASSAPSAAPVPEAPSHVSAAARAEAAAKARALTEETQAMPIISDWADDHDGSTAVGGAWSLSGDSRGDGVGGDAGGGTRDSASDEVAEPPSWEQLLGGGNDADAPVSGARGRDSASRGLDARDAAPRGTDSRGWGFEPQDAGVGHEPDDVDPLTNLFGGTPEPADSPDAGAAPDAGTKRGSVASTSSKVRSKKTKSKRQRGDAGRNTLAGIIVLVLVAALVGGGWWAWATFGERIMAQFNGPEDYPGPGHGEVLIHVAEGQYGADVAETLFDAGVIASTGAFVEAMEAHPNPSLMPGTYQMQLEMSAADALAILVDDANVIQTTVVIPEGLVVTSVYNRLSEGTGIPVEDFVIAASDPQSFGLPAEAVSIEGYLFPATYDFPPNLDARGILQVMVDRMIQALDEHGVPEADRYRIVTFASLIQREAGPVETFPLVACVFQNRLNIGMLLQSDATVAYGTGNLHVVTTSSEERADPSNPYNTYVHPGLPVGPIGAPGDVAIQSALTPQACPYLYFVTVNPETGETVFSETLAEHEAAAQQFYEWLQEHPEWGN